TRRSSDLGHRADQGLLSLTRQRGRRGAGACVRGRRSSQGRGRIGRRLDGGRAAERTGGGAHLPAKSMIALLAALLGVVPSPAHALAEDSTVYVLSPEPQV